ncbi:hypothetical protein [Escherichia coli]|uniref:hypothetical protein n=1 Tax=Escherichia coli TaxID=562 RepID=UPI00388F8FF1
MEIFWKPLGMGAVAVFIGIVLLWLIPEYKRRPGKAAVAVINIGVSLHARGGSRNDCSDDDDASRNLRNSSAKIVAADFTKFSFSWRKSHSK